MDINDIKPMEVGDRLRHEMLNAIVDQVKKNAGDIDRIEITGPSSMGGIVPNTAFVPDMGSPESPSIWFAAGGTPEAPVILPGFGGISLTSPLNVISWNGSTAVVKGVPIEVPQAENKIPDWQPAAYSAGVQRGHSGKRWQANANTLATDVPGISPKWDLKTFESYADSGIMYFVDLNDNILGYFDEKGLFVNKGLNADIAKRIQEAVEPLNNIFRTESAMGILEISDIGGNIIMSIDEYGTLKAKIAPGSIAYKDLMDTPLGETNTDDYLWTFQDGDKIIAAIDKGGKLIVQDIQVRNSTEEEEDNAQVLQITTKRQEYIPRPKFMRMDVEGPLPYDMSPALTPTEVVVTLRDGVTDLIKFNAELSLQGSGSLHYAKKGYTLDLLNSEFKSLDLKVGDMVATDSFHVKAFHTDITHTRDVGCGRLWYQAILKRPYPKNHFAPLQTGLTPVEPTYNDKVLFKEDAKFYTDGIPTEFYINGEFHGLYTFRMKKARQNYKLDNSNQNHIFIENLVTPAWMGAQHYETYADVLNFWEIRSPKTPGAEAQANILRFLNYMEGVYNDTIDLRATHADYLDLIMWLDYMIICEAVGNEDVQGNNLLPITYDGQHWGIVFYDADNSLGIYSTLKETESTRWMLSKDIYPKFRTVFDAEFKERYKFLKAQGVLTNENYKRVFGGISECIPGHVYKANYDKWGTNLTNGLPTMDQGYRYLNSRLQFLDPRWGA